MVPDLAETIIEYGTNTTRSVASLMYYNCAQTSNPIAMPALRTVLPVSQIVFGTDFPFRTTVETAKGLDTCGVFNVAEIRAINRENALKLLGRKP